MYRERFNSQRETAWVAVTSGREHTNADSDNWCEGSSQSGIRPGAIGIICFFSCWDLTMLSSAYVHLAIYFHLFI
jgi:hypothetical protein